MVESPWRRTSIADASAHPEARANPGAHDGEVGSQPPSGSVHRRLGTALTVIGALAIAGISLRLFDAVGATFFDGYALDLGSLTRVQPLHSTFLAHWFFFGTIAAIAATFGFARLPELHVFAGWRERSRKVSDPAFVVAAFAFAVLSAWLVLYLVLGTAELTDDESAYRFSSELLARGRLFIASHPVREAFDRTFMINDGRMYSQYFLGWPALMVPGVLVGHPELMNGIYSGLTIPPLYGLLRGFVPTVWARVGVVLYLLSPMVLVMSATKLSHTSCLMALTWTAFFLCRSIQSSDPRSSAGIAIAFSVAFFIRPYTALTVGTPLLVGWLVSVPRLVPQKRRASLVFMFVPAMLLALLFLFVNWVQNGSPWVTAYSRAVEYARETGFRFSPAAARTHMAGAFVFDRLETAVGHVGAGLFRFNAAAFGWPFALTFGVFAGLRRGAWIFWSELALHLAGQLFTPSSGIDTFAPVKYFELTMPVVALTAIGLDRISRWIPTLDIQSLRSRWRPIPMAAVSALCFVTFAGYAPVRLAAVARVATAINLPTDRLRAAGITHAVVFAPRPFIEWCRSRPTRHFRFVRPNNDPGLRNDILWVNDAAPPDKRRLMSFFPGRHGYTMRWTQECDVEFTALGAATPTSTPGSPTSGVPK